MIQLYNDDNYNVFSKLADKSVDLVITDPPYEFFYKKHGGGVFKDRDVFKETQLGKSNLNLGFDIPYVFGELIRIMKKINIYVFCHLKQIYPILDYMLNLNVDDLHYNLLTWHKTNPIPECSNCYIRDTEYILYFREKGVWLNGLYADHSQYYISPLTQSDKKLYKHPTIKPLQLIERFVRNSSNENDVVLDPFMGSGTTGVASKKLHRDFIGIELDKEYFDIANKRINSEDFLF